MFKKYSCRRRDLNPHRVPPLAPQASVSTNSTTSAKISLRNLPQESTLPLMEEKILVESFHQPVLIQHLFAKLTRMMDRLSLKAPISIAKPINAIPKPVVNFVIKSLAPDDPSIEFAVPLIIEFSPPCPDCIKTTTIKRMLIIVCIVIKN